MKSCLKILLICVVSYPVVLGICSYYPEIVETGTHWKCNMPLENVTSIFVTDFPTSKIPALNRKILEPFEKLEHIHIGKCEIETVAPDTFTGYQLKSLYLNMNKIRKIEKGTLNSLNMTTSFEMTFNDLEALEDDTFVGMVSLSWMSLSANKIGRIDEHAFRGLEQLEALFLSSNKITSLHVDTFRSLQKLGLLEISDNPLTHIQFGLFSHLRNLQRLILGHNEIEELPNNIFNNLTALQMLDISQNKISEVKDTLFGQVLENFVEFKIYSNQITSFNAVKFFIRAPRIKKIELYDNPWSCAELERLRGEFLKRNVSSPIYVRAKTKPNVDGIACNL